MSDQLTDQKRETLARAKAREGKTTPAPWVRDTRWYTMAIYADSGDVMVAGSNHDEQLEIPNDIDAELITDAPNLDALAIAQADIIQRQAARIAELEADKAHLIRAHDGDAKHIEVTKYGGDYRVAVFSRSTHIESSNSLNHDQALVKTDEYKLSHEIPDVLVFRYELQL